MCDLRIVLPETAACHAVLEELLQIVGVGLGYLPFAVLMGFIFREEPSTAPTSLFSGLCGSRYAISFDFASFICFPADKTLMYLVIRLEFLQPVACAAFGDLHVSGDIFNRDVPPRL